MSTQGWGVWSWVGVGAVLAAGAGCNAERKQDCDALLAAMKPLDQGTPSVEVVDGVSKQVAGLQLHDDTLRIYAKNYRETLGVLSSTIALKASPNAPDGTDEVVKQKLKAARTDAADVARYCAN
jgi:hypothetical protein